MKRKEVEIQEIKSEIKNNIEEYHWAIKLFIDNLNSIFEGDQITCDSKHFIIKTEKESYKKSNDIATVEFEYEAYWCFQLNPNVEIKKAAVIASKPYQEECLWFVYKDVEVITGDSCFYKGNKTMHIYISGIETPREDLEIKEIDHINSNYSMEHIINDYNIVSCVLELETLAKRRNKLSKLEYKARLKEFFKS